MIFLNWEMEQGSNMMGKIMGEGIKISIWWAGGSHICSRGLDCIVKLMGFVESALLDLKSKHLFFLWCILILWSFQQMGKIRKYGPQTFRGLEKSLLILLSHRSSIFFHLQLSESSLHLVG